VWHPSRATDRRSSLPYLCAIESAVGVFVAREIASVPGVRHLAMGGVDLQRDLNAGNGNLRTL
jgi:citrate lyase subunit beta/citryl-CoA lyase